MQGWFGANRAGSVRSAAVIRMESMEDGRYELEQDDVESTDIKQRQMGVLDEHQQHVTCSFCVLVSNLAVSDL